MFAIKIDRFATIASLSHGNHIGLTVDDRRQTGTHHEVVFDDHDAQSFTFAHSIFSVTRALRLKAQSPVRFDSSVSAARQFFQRVHAFRLTRSGPHPAGLCSPYQTRSRRPEQITLSDLGRNAV